MDRLKTVTKEKDGESGDGIRQGMRKLSLGTSSTNNQHTVTDPVLPADPTATDSDTDSDSESDEDLDRETKRRLDMVLLLREIFINFSPESDRAEFSAIQALVNEQIGGQARTAAANGSLFTNATSSTANILPGNPFGVSGINSNGASLVPNLFGTSSSATAFWNINCPTSLNFLQPNNSTLPALKPDEFLVRLLASPHLEKGDAARVCVAIRAALTNSWKAGLGEVSLKLEEMRNRFMNRSYHGTATVVTTTTTDTVTAHANSSSASSSSVLPQQGGVLAAGTTSNESVPGPVIMHKDRNDETLKYLIKSLTTYTEKVAFAGTSSGQIYKDVWAELCKMGLNFEEKYKLFRRFQEEF